ncbi:MAG: hypothetical protein NVSMB23_27110 [Myxococcales bacterium]
MSNILVINASGQETRVALIEQGIISEYYLERKNEKGIVGNIYKGKVVRVLPGMQAAFVDIGLDKAAFLYVADIVSDPNFPGFSEELDEQASTVEGDPLEAEDLAEPSEDALPAAAELTAGAADASFAASAPAEVSSAVEPAPPLAPPAPLAASSVPDRASAPQLPADPGATSPGPSASPEVVPAGAAAEAPPAQGEVLELAAEDALDDDEEEGEEEGEDEGEEGLDEGDAAHAAAEAELAAEARRSDEGAPAGAAPEAAPDSGAGAGQPASVEAAAAPASGQRGVPADPRGAGRERKGRRRGGRGRRRGGEGQRPAGAASAGGEAGQSGPAAHGRPERRHGANGFEGRERRTQGHAHGGGAEPSGKARNGHGHGKRAQIQDLLKEGDEVLVQAVKDPIGTKGARITCHISLPGRHLVFMPTVDHVGISRRIENEKERRRLRELVDKYRPAGTGFIVRTVAENEPSEKLTADIKFLLGLWNEVGKKLETMRAPALIHPDLDLILRSIRDLFSDEVNKVVIDDRAEYERVKTFVEQVAPDLASQVELFQGDEPIFDEFGVEQELVRASNRKVWLKSGGYIIIDQTEALVAIDVNSGRYTGKKSLEETITKINCEAAKEIVYQLRLRNIGGIIIIDFIDMDKGQNREKVFKTLQESLGADRAKTNVLKISDIGLVEMTRKRVRESVGRLMNESCPVCDGRGHVRSKVTMAYEIMREAQRAARKHREDQLIVNCHPDVAKLLQGPEREALRLLMMRLNKSIVVRVQPQYHVEQYDLHGKWSRPELQQANGNRGGVRREDGRGSRRDRDQARGEPGRGDASRGEAGRAEPVQASAQAGSGALDTKVGD